MKKLDYKKMKSYIVESSEANATKEGMKLMKKLPKCWELRVWENLGWHYAAHYKNMSIHSHYYRNEPVQYHILMSDRKLNDDLVSSGGSGNWIINKFDKDPVRLIKLQLQKAKQYVKVMNEVIENNEAALKDN